jgi:hypothetical protein
VSAPLLNRIQIAFRDIRRRLRGCDGSATSESEHWFAIVDGFGRNPEGCPGGNCNAGSYLRLSRSLGFLAAELQRIEPNELTLGGWLWRILSGFAM